MRRVVSSLFACGLVIGGLSLSAPQLLYTQITFSKGIIGASIILATGGYRLWEDSISPSRD